VVGSSCAVQAANRGLAWERVAGRPAPQCRSIPGINKRYEVNLKAELELALGRSRTEAELLEALASAGEETERLVRLAEDLLVLARTNGHRPSIAREPVDVGELVEHEAAANTVNRRGRRVATGLRVYGDACRQCAWIMRTT